MEGLLASPIPVPLLVAAKLFPYFVLGLAATAVCVGVGIVAYDLLAVSGLILLAGAGALPTLDTLTTGTCIVAGTLLLALAFGVVWQPGFLDGFSMSADYYEIDIAGALADYEIGVRYAPTHQPIWYQRGLLRYQRGEYQRGLVR